jgi:hypothetical protein
MAQIFGRKSCMGHNGSFLFLVPFLTSDCQDAVGKFHLDVFVFHSERFGRDLITFISLRDVDCRYRAECRFGPPERLDIEKRTAERRMPDSAVIE